MPTHLRKRKRSNFDKEEAVVVSGISVLGEDLLYEILLQLPPSSLLNIISVSRSFLRVCSSPLFRLHYRSRRSSSLLGFFVNLPIIRTSFISVSSPSTAVYDLGFTRIYDSRRGWLLLNDLPNSFVRLFHPIFNETVAIVRHPSFRYSNTFFIALLPDPSSLNPRCRVRIVCVLSKPSSCPIILIFSSENPHEWKMIQSLHKIDIGHCNLKIYPILVDGFVHWLKYDRQILCLNENSYELSLLSLPRGIPRGILRRLTNHWLGKFKDQLCYAYVEESVLCIWVLVDRLHCEWHLEQRVELGNFPELISHCRHARFLAIGISGSLNAIFQGLMGNIYSLGLGSGELREIGNAEFIMDCVFPYTSMDAD